MRLLVTGAGGFIGRAAVRALAARGDRVVAHIGPPGCGLASPPGAVSSFELDIAEAAGLEPAMRGCDAVVHMAGPAGVRPSFADPAGYLRAHALGTAALADAAVRAGVPRFVYVSSAEVYGRSDNERVHENAPLRPRSPYAAAKVAAEACVSACARAGDVRAAVLRPFSVYGPGQRGDSLLALIVEQARREDSLSLRDLSPVRDYVHVDDVAAAIACATGACIDDVLVANVGTGTGTSVGALAATVLDVLGSSARVRELGADRGPSEIVRLIAGTEHAAAALGWRARVGLRAGIAALLEIASA